jgi:hypothetical protein
MGVSFTSDADPPLFVETVAAEEEEAFEFRDDPALLARSAESSISEYDGPASALPWWYVFGPKECRRIFDMDSNREFFSGL